MPAIATAAGDFDERGTTLRDRLKECLGNGLPGLPVAELLDHLDRVAADLDDRHISGGVHGQGVSPDVIRLVGGLARLDGPTTPEWATDPRMNLGCPSYLAPEVWGGKIGPEGDQYALACTYTELRTGRLPFTADSFPALMHAHLSGVPNLDGCTNRERAVLTRALAKDPNQRFPTCGRLVHELRRAAGV